MLTNIHHFSRDGPMEQAESVVSRIGNSGS